MILLSCWIKQSWCPYHCWTSSNVSWFTSLLFKQVWVEFSVTGEMILTEKAELLQVKSMGFDGTQILCIYFCLIVLNPDLYSFNLTFWVSLSLDLSGDNLKYTKASISTCDMPSRHAPFVDFPLLGDKCWDIAPGARAFKLQRIRPQTVSGFFRNFSNSRGWYILSEYKLMDYGTV